MALNRGPFNALVDDDGSGTTGTPWNKAQIAGVTLDPVDAELARLDAAMAGIQTDPGGAVTEVQFHDAGGTFGGDNGLTYDKATEQLTAYAVKVLTGVEFPSSPVASGPNTLNGYAIGAWTPNDASGASLSLTKGTCLYVKVGQFVLAQFSVTYPTTSNGNNVLIGNLPFFAQNATGFGGPLTFTNLAGGAVCNVNNSSDSFALYLIGSTTRVTNSQVSGKLLEGYVLYRSV